ncbi:MAG: DUF3006 domain-containing protein [Clostridia bacterium]|nr:DUF3006 domain-containing protein [Clostridia bacterium]
MDYTLDRVENGVAVLVSLDGSSVINVKAEELSDAKEGDMLRQTDTGFTVLHESTKERKLSLAKRFEKLKSKNK